ncbi:MAG: alpha-amylase [Ignavibacteria bacterium]|nr:alpha-amylase [Ignavibacteria bacterium]
MKTFSRFTFFIFVAFNFCTGFTPGQGKHIATPPRWSYDKCIYEVNLRQYTKSGTIKDFIPGMQKLKDMGVGILWLMPVHPIGEVNRKGSLGSYYSVKDYYGLDANLGTKADFRTLVTTAHQMGMYVILDWVANHTAWDNALAKEHPDYFTLDSNGKFVPPVADWHDVIDLNYDNKGLWDYMAGAMEFWVKEFNIDGFRCDVASMVPTAFWQYTRERLDKTKPVFMLAEAEELELHNNAFDMTYSWNLMSTMMRTARGERKPAHLMELVSRQLKEYPEDAFRMRFTTNHDENSWNGTSVERFGKAVDCYNVFTATIPGMFLVYSGQEAGETKRLNFFEKDPIDWKEHSNYSLFTKLMHLKSEHAIFRNGKLGGSFESLVSDTNIIAVAFIRELAGKKAVVFINFNDKPTSITVNDKRLQDTFKEYFSGRTIVIDKASTDIQLKPYEYQIWIKD